MKRILPVVILLVFFSGIGAQTTRYVKPTASGSGDGSSWANASADLQAMITASASGDQVWVAAGIYKPASNTSYSMKTGVSIYGGFAGTETLLGQRNWVTNVSNLQGNGVVIISNSGITSTALLDGFTISNGTAAGSGLTPFSGGMNNNSSSPTIVNCIFKNNTTTGGYGPGASGGGGAMRNGSSSPIITNCIFLNNNANGTGGAMANYSSSPIITNCSFYGNSASVGKALYQSGAGVPVMKNCIVWNGSSEFYNDFGSNPTVTYSDLDLAYGGTGNINADPLFVDATNGNLKLGAGSPAINTGSSAAVPGGVTVDLANATRIVGSSVDMGAYEYFPVGSGLNFDGVNDYVSISNPFTAFNKEITVEFWMNTPSANLTFGSIIGQGVEGQDNPTNNVWLMHPNNNGTASFYVNDAGNFRNITFNLTANSWHHIAGVAGPLGMKVYVDGVLAVTGAGITGTILNNASSVIHIGKDVRWAANVDPRFGNFSLDEVRIWNRALCQDEIVNNKNCEPNPATQTGLVEYYRFNQGIENGTNTGTTTLTDNSGNGRDGTLNNFALTTGATSNWIASGSTNTGTCAAYVAPTAAITGITTVCIGSGSILSNTNAGGVWTSSNTAVATINSSTGVVASVSAGTTTITYQTECGGVSTATFTVNALPIATITASGSTAICAGGSVTLTGVGGTSYVWSTGATSTTINVVNAGTYSVTATNASGCSATSTNTAVTVNALPTATITASGSTTFCAGGSVTLTGVGGTSYVWSTGATSTTINVVNAGTYSVTATNVSGCSATSTITTVTVNALPTATITASGSTAICAGGSVTLTGVGGTSYVWSTGATSTTINIATAGTYSVTATNASGCSATSTITTVTVNALPTATITAGGPTTFCAGGSVNLTGVGGTSYVWSTGATSTTINVATAGTYSVTATNASGCSATSTNTTVTVNALPTATITASGSTTFCAGGSVTLTGVGGTSYVWSTGATSTTINVVTAGTYSVTATNASGCSATSTNTTVTVNALPTATITASGSTTFCAGGSVTLTGVGGTSYVWSTGAISTTINVATVGTYSVTVTNGNGCSSTSTSTTVTVNSLPTATITAGGPTTFCAGGSVTLTASAGTSWLWSTGATTQAINVVTAGTYSVTVTNGNGCSSTSTSTTVIVNSLPTATITAVGSTTFCAGGSVTLTGVGGTSYVWSTGATSTTINVATAGTYSVTATNASGCSATSTNTTVTVNALPTATITAGGPTTFCAGGSVTLTGVGGTSYVWSTGATSTTINVATAGTYSVTVTNGNGCSSTSTSTTVTVNSLPTATITAGGSTTFCAGGSVTLTASAGTSWFWSTGATTQAINVATAGTYSVTVTNGNGCSSTSTSTTVTVNSLPTATITAVGPTTFCAGGSVNLTASTGTSWLWSTGATTQAINVVTAGTYSVTVTNGNGCSSTSTSTTVIVNSLPTATITAGGSTTFCAGGSVTLTGVGGTSYVWSTGATSTTINLVNAGTYSVTATNASGCSATSTNTTVTVNALPTATITASGSTTFCAGGSVTLTGVGGTSYIWSTGATSTTINVVNAGTYSVTTTNASGCSATSTITTVAIKQPTTSTTNVSICSNSSPYNWNGNNYSLPGTYTKTFANGNAAGCDSIATLILNFNQVLSSTTNVSICASALPYLWNGNSYTAAGTYTKIFTGGGVGGCDSSASLVLTVKQTSTSTTNVSICAAALPYLWNGNNYTTAGTYNVRLTNAVGCDSIASLVLTLKQATTSSTNVSICAASLPYSWNGKSYTTAGTYTTTLTNAAGCDSVATLVLALKQASTTSTTNVSICAASLPYSWNGKSYTTAGTYTTTLTNAAGCDSVATLVLTLKQATASTTNVSICAVSLPYSWNGKSYTTAGTYTATLTNAAGCDSVATLVLTLKQATTSTTNVSVCASALPYLWNGKSYTTAGTYTTTLTNAAGCDSVATLVLTLKEATTSTTNVSVCASVLPYLWNGKSYTTAGNYTATLTNTAGCDSIATLILTIKQLSSSITNISVCASSLPYSWNGKSYSAAGTYSIILTNAVGCDSAASLVLTVNANPAIPTISNSRPLSFCTGDSTILSSSSSTNNQWLLNGTNISGAVGNQFITKISGVYTVQVVNASGCTATSASVTTTNRSTVGTGLAIHDTLICKATSVSVTASASLPSTYSWTSVNTGFTSTASQVSISKADLYRVRITLSNGCIVTDSINVRNTADTAIKAKLSVSSHAFINQVVVLVNVTSPAPQSQNWVLPGSAIVNIKNDSVVMMRFANPGNYMVYLTNKSYNVCSSSDSAKIVVTTNDSSNVVSAVPIAIRNITIGPNPTTGIMNIGVELNQLGKTSLRIYDGSGTLTYSKNISPLTVKFTEKVDISAAPGNRTYVLVVQTKDGYEVRTIIKL